MSERAFNVLFLCTGNSARSIIGEVLANDLGKGRLRAFSAGSNPKGSVHPMAIEVLRSMGFETECLCSKSWNEFSGPDAPEMDFVFTVCGNAANEECPVWPGHPVTAHWGLDDPAAVEGEEQREAFLDTLRYMRRRIELFLELPIVSLERMSLARKVQDLADEQARIESAG